MPSPNARPQGINYAPLTLNSSNSSSSSAQLTWTGVLHGLWLLANSSCPPPTHSLNAGQYDARQLVAPANDGSYTITCNATNKTGAAVSTRGSGCLRLRHPHTHTFLALPTLHLLCCRPGMRAPWTITATRA